MTITPSVPGPSFGTIATSLKSGMTIGIAGWGPRRKPMALIRAILRSDLTDLTIVAYGGPEVGMLCAAGKVKKLIFGFVSMDAIPLEPYFRKAREAGTLDILELDEAFAAQAGACLRELGLADIAAHVNPNGGASAFGHPLGMLAAVFPDGHVIGPNAAVSQALYIQAYEPTSVVLPP